jgi:predicted Zn-dependent peptidase
MPFGRVAYTLGLCLGLSLAASGARAQDAAEVSAGIERYHELTLANGLRVVLAVDQRVPQVALSLEYAVGDALDPPDQRGLAQLIGKILARLDTRHLHADERPRLLSAAGFKYEAPNVLVGPDATSETLQVPAEALELALWLEADRMGFAADGVTQTALSEALPQALEAVERLPNDSAAPLAFHAALGRLHPYGALDRASQLQALKATAVAERLRRYYNPASAVLVLVGDLEPERTEQAVRRLFGSLPSAAVQPPPAVRRSATPRLLSLTAPVPARFGASAWETPSFLSPDDAGLDVVATVLARRLRARALCDAITVGQRSRALTSVFVASCEGPKTTLDAFRAALNEELHALAESRVPASEIEGTALYYAALMGERYDDLLGRAQAIASSVLLGQGAQIIPKLLDRYRTTDAAQLASIVRRHLLRPADGTFDVTPLASAPRAGSAYFAGASEPMFQARAEPPALATAASGDWPRPPANGAPHRFHPPTGPSDTLANGDQLRFMERFGTPVAHARLQIAWPAAQLNPALGLVLAELLAKSPVAGSTLEDTLRVLGVELKIRGPVDQLELTLTAPPSRMAPAFAALSSVLTQKQLSSAAFAAASASTAEWVNQKHDDGGWTWYWDALGLSAPKSRYRYLSSPARKLAAEHVKMAEINRLWPALQRQPRAVELVGPYDNATARSLAAQVLRPAAAPVVPRPAPNHALFHAGVYVFDRASEPSRTDEPASVSVCVLWPLPGWATPGHYPAHLMPWFFRPELTDGLGARLAEHGARIPYWQSNTLLNREQDFLRYSLRVPVDQLAPVLESLKAHLARLAEGHVSATDFANAVAAERQYQIRQSLSGQAMIAALQRAAEHDRQGDEALDIALQVERVSPKALSELAQHLTFDRATIGVIGPAARVNEALKTVGLTATTIVQLTPDEGHEGAAR